MLINNRVEEPYSRLPPDGPLPILSKSLVKCQLTKHYFNRKKYLRDPKLTISEKASPINNNDILEKKEALINQKTIKNKKKNNTINSHLKKRAKTPNFRKNNLKDRKNQSYKILHLNINKDKDKYKDKDKKYYNDINKEKNDNKNNKFIIDNNNSKDICSDNDFHNIKNDYFFHNNNNDDKFNCVDNNNFDNNELNILKDNILKLEEELNKKEKIIELQREERVKLTLKVDELENMFASMKSTKKY